MRRSLLDHPNPRSSHTAPTPRGGGLAIVLITLLAVVWVMLDGAIAWRNGIALIGGGLLIAGIGWVDDVRPLSAGPRVLVHLAAAGWFLVWIGGVDALRLGTGLTAVGWWGNLVALVGLVWSINLYNFMDGIDGLAGGQAVLVGGVGALLLFPVFHGAALISMAAAGASLGFLFWNWAPARIFMGDVGSGFLGFLFGALALLADRDGGPGVITWMMLGGVFVVDATLTVLRRMLRGERWYAAHRTHAYQRAVQSGWSHARVTLGALCLTLVAAVLAWAGFKEPRWFWPAFAIEGLLLSGVYLLIERRAPMRAE